MDVVLRDVVDSDLPVFFEHQRDPTAVHLVGLPSRDHDAFYEHWARIRQDETSRLQTVVVDGTVAGNLVTFLRSGEREVGYWLGREFWGRGIATEALGQFLGQITERPLSAFVSKHNAGSVRVLQKCGFTIVGEEDDGITLHLA